MIRSAVCSFQSGADFPILKTVSKVTLTGQLTESERHADVGVRSVVIVGIPVVVDITEVGSVARVRGLTPPVVPGAAQNAYQ